MCGGREGGGGLGLCGGDACVGLVVMGWSAAVARGAGVVMGWTVVVGL